MFPCKYQIVLSEDNVR